MFQSGKQYFFLLFFSLFTIVSLSPFSDVVAEESVDQGSGESGYYPYPDPPHSPVDGGEDDGVDNGDAPEVPIPGDKPPKQDGDNGDAGNNNPVLPDPEPKAQCHDDSDCDYIFPPYNVCLDDKTTGKYTHVCYAGKCEQRGPNPATCRRRRFCTDDTGVCSGHRPRGDFPESPIAPGDADCGNGSCDVGENPYTCPLDCQDVPFWQECGVDFCSEKKSMCSGNNIFHYTPVCRSQGCYYVRRSAYCSGGCKTTRKGKVKCKRGKRKRNNRR